MSAPSPSPSPSTPAPAATQRLVYFTAPWCAVCHEKAPVVEQIATASGLPLERWDIEAPAGRAEFERLRMRTVPALALLRGERVPFRLVGRMITPDNVRHLLAQFGGAQ